MATWNKNNNHDINRKKEQSELSLNSPTFSTF